MVKGKLYKLANLHKNKKNHWITSYSAGITDGIGWLWTANYPYNHISTFKDGDAFVCLGKKQIAADEPSGHLGIDTWYEALGPDGKIHRFTRAMRSSYFRSP
tara:strand:+ start:32 stop:337 length:306 start_codon:yes stop_codon:yes gene_type:complete